MHPRRSFFGFLLLLLEHVLVGNRDGYLGFDLQQLVLHIQNHLLDHLLGVFRLVHQIVEIRPTRVATRSKSAIVLLLIPCFTLLTLLTK